MNETRILMNEKTMNDIADAIIAKGGNDQPMYPREMASSIMRIQGGKSSLNWGEISGNIQNQADLQDVLRQKANASSTLSGYGITDASITGNTVAIAGSTVVVPTKVSQLNNDVGYTTNAGTITGIKENGKTVGISGIVDIGNVISAHQQVLADFSDGVKIATVGQTDIYIPSSGQAANDGKLTIRQNGSTVGQFTANQDTDVVVDIADTHSSQIVQLSSYALVNGQLSEEGGFLACHIQNSTITNIDIDRSDVPVKIYIPAPAEMNAARDFVIRANVTALTPPAMQFVPEVSEQVQFESKDIDWMTLARGINILSFTETKRS